MMNIDWSNGTWTAQSTDNTPTACITFASDWMPLRAFEQLVLNEPLAVYGDLLNIFRDSDLNLVNVECVLGEAGEPIPKNGPCLRADVRAAESLRGANFHVGLLANNHTLDAGPESLASTITTLQRAGLKTVGAGLTGDEAAVPLVLEVKGLRIGLINCAEGEACASIDNGPGANPFDVPSVIKQIASLKRQVDCVIVVFHGGREYSPLPPVYVVNALRQFADAGPTAIIGHHPHVPQGIEIHNGVPIVYSQGNFVFWSDTPLYFRHHGFLVHLDFAGKQLSKLSLTPYRIERTGLRRLTMSEQQTLFAHLAHVSRMLTNAKAVREAWDAWVDHEGQAWMIETVEGYMKTFKEDPRLAAGRMHNIFFCPAHREAYLNGLKRLAKGELGNSPQWAKDLVKQWVETTL